MASTWKTNPPYAPLKDEAKHTARCFCGRVEIDVLVDPKSSALCSCSQCTRLHGTSDRWICEFDVAAVGFSPSSLQWLRWYSPLLDTSTNDGAVKPVPAKVQCLHCGTWLGDERTDTFVASPALFGTVATDGAAAVPVLFHPRERLHCSTRALGLAAAAVPQFVDDGRTPASVGDFLRAVAPALDGSSYKGQGGRVGVVGGSKDYTGAPFYTAHSALRAGAELVSVYTADAAAGPIKSYSPELMVSAVYSVADMQEAGRAEAVAEMVHAVAEALPRLHVLVVGPGLGRSPRVLEGVAGIIEAAKARNMLMVIDADGLWLINQRPDLVRGYSHVILTPNAMEFRRLAAAVLGSDRETSATGPELAKALSGPIVFQKGRVDRICTHDGAVLESAEVGAPKRPGGLGDMLCGVLAAVLPWAIAAGKPSSWACLAAGEIARRACQRAFHERGRSLVAEDVINKVGVVFEEFCPLAIAVAGHGSSL